MDQTRLGSPANQRRIARELRTVRAMIGIYCADLHGGRDGLCAGCAELWDYAHKRVDHCPFLDDKPTCVNCTVHCYKPLAREQIRTVMRYAGPRMPWRHPLLTFWHLVNGKKPAPTLPRRQRSQPSVDPARAQPAR